MRGSPRAASEASPARNVWKKPARRSTFSCVEELGQRAAQHEAVLQRIAGAGRRLGAVGEHPPAAVRPAPEIGGVELQVAAARGGVPTSGRRNSGLPATTAAGRRPRRPAGRRRRCRPEALQQGRRAGRGPADAPAIPPVDQERQVRQRPGPLLRRRLVIDPVEDADIAQVAVGDVEAPADLGRPPARQARRAPAASAAARRRLASIISSGTPGSGR